MDVDAVRMLNVVRSSRAIIPASLGGMEIAG